MDGHHKYAERRLHSVFSMHALYYGGRVTFSTKLHKFLKASRHACIAIHSPEEFELLIVPGILNLSNAYYWRPLSGFYGGTGGDSFPIPLPSFCYKLPQITHTHAHHPLTHTLTHTHLLFGLQCFQHCIRWVACSILVILGQHHYPFTELQLQLTIQIFLCVHTPLDEALDLLGTSSVVGSQCSWKEIKLCSLNFIQY